MQAECSYLEKSNILFYVKLDLEGNYKYLSPNFCDHFGYKYEDYIGVHSFETICEEDHQLCLDIIQKCLKNPEKAFAVKLRKPAKDDKIFFTQWEFTLELDEDKKPMEYSCIGFDITKKVNRRSEIAQLNLQLEGSKQQYQALFDTSSLAIILHDLDGKLILANDTFCKLLKIEHQNFTDYNLYQFIENKNWKATKELLTALEKEGKNTAFEFELIDAEKNLIPVYINKLIFKDWTGKPLVWGVITDITERKKHINLLETQKELLEKSANIAKLGGWELNLKTLEATWTKEVYEIHDLPYNSIGLFNLDNSLNYFLPNDRQLIKDAIDLTIKEGKPYHLELKFISAKKVNKWVIISGEAMYHNDKIVGIKGIIQDITERKSFEETIISQNELLTEIYYSQSHLMRLPLANILGLVSLLEIETDKDEIEIIKRKLKLSATQLDEVIKELAIKKNS
ncbi:PAS domain-containing protein [Pedobacter sp. SD-b]|uniref:histidine kinase n=1 Tax=Pedobacter segetis TaxID=2793069 RepID=A0ABS1BN74_9SPHI|nr:PAS domain-containing protein [Pedobacter segetis]MBK0384343.1 PAS domain-containing protein [Pedobacter segetis]